MSASISYDKHDETPEERELASTLADVCEGKNHQLIVNTMIRILCIVITDYSSSKFEAKKAASLVGKAIATNVDAFEKIESIAYRH
jgi:hypothetical protein